VKVVEKGGDDEVALDGDDGGDGCVECDAAGGDVVVAGCPAP
jgi:hypothetical protein